MHYAGNTTSQHPLSIGPDTSNKNFDTGFSRICTSAYWLFFETKSHGRLQNRLSGITLTRVEHAVSNFGGNSDYPVRRSHLIESLVPLKYLLSYSRYTPKRATLDAEKRMFFDSCVLSLRGWFFSLPNELKVKLSDRPEQVNASPHAYILNMVYYTSIILLAKPFLPRRRNDFSHGLEAQDASYSDLRERAFSLCHEAATNICLLGERYREAFGSFRRSPLTATHCTLTAVLVRLFLGCSQKTDRTNDISRDLRSCMSTLRELSDSWTPARRFWETLRKVLQDRFQSLDGHRSLRGEETCVLGGNEANGIRHGASQQYDASRTHLAEAESSATRAKFNRSFLADGTDVLHLIPAPDFDQLDFSFLDEFQWDCMNDDILGLGFHWNG